MFLKIIIFKPIKIDPVAFGGSCSSWDQCENGTYCDLDWQNPNATALCLR